MKTEYETFLTSRTPEHNTVFPGSSFGLNEEGLERFQRLGMKMIKEPLMKSLEELGLLSLERRKLRGDLTATFKYSTWRVITSTGASCSPAVPMVENEKKKLEFQGGISVSQRHRGISGKL